MKEDRIVRVLCRSCKKEHAFRHTPERKPSVRKPQAAANREQKRVEAAAEDWRAEMYKVKDRAGKPYAMDGLFETGDKVIHRTFGTGIVMELISSDKMNVLFETGIKLLVRGVSRK